MKNAGEAPLRTFPAFFIHGRPRKYGLQNHLRKKGREPDEALSQGDGEHIFPRQMRLRLRTCHQYVANMR